MEVVVAVHALALRILVKWTGGEERTWEDRNSNIFLAAGELK